MIKLRNVRDFTAIPSCLKTRCMAVQAKVLKKNDSSTKDDKWLSAKSFDKLPGPSKFGLIRAFLPGGKYHKKTQFEIFKIAREEYGNIYRLPGVFGQPDMIYTYDPNDFEKVFRLEGSWPQRFNLFSVHYFRNVEKKEFYKKTTGVAIDHGQSWGEARTATNPLLMQPRIATQYTKPIDTICVEIIERMKRIRDPKTLELPADFAYDLNRWALEAMGIIGLDTRLGLINGFDKNPEAKELIDKITRFFQLIYKLDIKPSLSRYVATPEFKEMMQVQYDLQKITIRYIDKALERIKNNPPKPDHEKSVLERLINVDREIALVMVTDMLMFGVDTTSTGFVSCIYQLSKNPKKQAKLFDEIKGILPTKDSPLTKDNMVHLPYLRACMKEALRLTPVFVGNTRILNHDLVLSGYQVPNGATVQMPSQVVQNEDKQFPASDKFIPERWLKDQSENTECPSAKTAHPFSYLPFGFGPRMCIGKRMAHLEIEIGLVRIFRNFNVEYNYGEMEYESQLLNVPKGELKFKITDVSN